MRPLQKAEAVVLLMALLLTIGCTVRLVPPVPADQVEQAQVPGMPAVRDWGDRYSPVIEQSLIEAWEQRQRAGGDGHEWTFLVLSGGGTDGAYGAGLLCGWSEAGGRPDFDIVTGISTGALMAPFAFLGPAQDQKLRDLYTRIATRDLLRLRWLLDALTRDALADTDPLVNLVRKAVDADVLQAVAREHAKGRRLFVGTTNLDAQRPVIWDMGAIAASGRPEALELFRKVMVASASIPAVCPPQYFDVQAGGRKYQEMHVDGGTIMNALHFGQVIDRQTFLTKLKGFPPDVTTRMYLVRNSPMRPEWQGVKARLVPIARRAISTMLKAHAAEDIYRLYAMTQFEGTDFNLAYIPDDFIPQATGPFDTVDMPRLFELGFAAAKSGTAWAKTPPGVVNATTQPACGGPR